MRISISILVWLCVLNLYAQSDSTDAQGEIISGEVVIEKTKEITLPQADKIFFKTLSKPFVNESLNLTFKVKEPSFEWPDYKSDVPLQMIDETYPIAKYQNYVKLGYGNYGSPLFETGLFRMYGSFDTRFKIFYESFKSGPINGENSGNSDGGINLSSTYTARYFSITPSLSYENRKYKFYGNTDRINSGFGVEVPMNVSLNNLSFSVELKGGGENVTYEVKPLFNSTNQGETSGSLLNKELQVGVGSKLGYTINNFFTTGFDLEVSISSYGGELSYSRSLLNVNPWVKHQKNSLSITAGFTLSSGNVADNSKTGFYPNVRVDYDLSDKWVIYGILTGGQIWNGLNNLLNRNRFLDTSLSIRHTEFTSRFGGGIKGNFMDNLLFEASLINNSTRELPFFVPSSTDSSRYILTYDTKPVNILSLESSLSYMPTTTSIYGVSLEINSYSVKSLDRPWNKPRYILKAYTSHNVKEKLIISSYLISMIGIRSPANVDFGFIDLSVFVDVGIDTRYVINERISAFININNLLNKEYERYLGYPIRGVAFKIGGQYRF